MPDKEELETIVERSISEFPDDDAWEQLKAEIETQWAPDPEEVLDAYDR